MDTIAPVRKLSPTCQCIGAIKLIKYKQNSPTPQFSSNIPIILKNFGMTMITEMAKVIIIIKISTWLESNILTPSTH